PRIEAVGIDGTVLAFTGGITVLLGFLFGLAPAVQAARPALTGMLKDGVRASHRGGLRSALVVSEVALAIVLLIGAGLMLKSFRRWIAVDPGFRAERVLTFAVSLPDATYPKREQQVAFQRSRESSTWLEIVGVVGHVMQNSPKDDEHTQLYQPFGQAAFTQLGFAVRTRADPVALVPQIRRLVLSIDPRQPIYDI